MVSHHGLRNAISVKSRSENWQADIPWESKKGENKETKEPKCAATTAGVLPDFWSTTSRSFRSRNYVHARCLDSSTFQVAVSGHTPATKQGGGYSSARTLFGHHGFFTCRESLPHRAFLWPHRLLSRPPSLEPLKGMWTPSQGFQRRTWQTLNPQDWEESSRKPGFGSQPARVQWLEVFFGHVCFTDSILLGLGQRLRVWCPGSQRLGIKPSIWGCLVFDPYPSYPCKIECMRAGDPILSIYSSHRNYSDRGNFE